MPGKRKGQPAMSPIQESPAEEAAEEPELSTAPKRRGKALKAATAAGEVPLRLHSIVSSKNRAFNVDTYKPAQLWSQALLMCA